jgi:zinc transporter, ZIP family
MPSAAEIVLYTAAASACIPLGGLLARIERLRPAWLENELRHFVIAFGGGVLVAAVALVLVPEGIEQVRVPARVAFYFLGGGLLFFWLEQRLARAKLETPQFLAMLLDYVPESLALGGAFAAGLDSAPLLAALIGIQNLPEGFNAYRELRALAGGRARRPLLMMSLLVPIGPLLALGGWLFLSDYPQGLGAIMLVASGGILYLIFQDLAPQAQLRNHWFPPLGAVSGFALGLLALLWTGG